MPHKETPLPLIQKLDRWFIFRPARWPHRELISRATALLIIAGLMAWRLYNFERFPGTLGAAKAFYGGFKAVGGASLYSSLEILGLWAIKLTVWTIETLIYLGYVASYASRAKAIKIADGFMETAFPIIVAGIPILMSFLPYSLPRWAPYGSTHHVTFYLAIMVLIVAGGLLNLIGLLTLRRAFTIMTEARALITHGIFGYIRHPLYSGHFIMFCGSMMLRLSWVAVSMYLVFFCGQVLRAKLEERKLVNAFAEYEQYQERTGMFFPRWAVLRRRN